MCLLLWKKSDLKSSFEGAKMLINKEGRDLCSVINNTCSYHKLSV